MFHDEVGERAGSVLLLALEVGDQAEVEVWADGLNKGPDGGDMRHDAGLVIRRAAAV